MDAAGKQGLRNCGNMISATRARNLFKHMMHGCVFCEVVIDSTEKAVGYSIIAHNDAMIALVGNDAAGNDDRAVKDFFDEINLLSVFEEVRGDSEYVAWEQYLSMRQKWYSISAFSTEPQAIVLMVEDISERKQLASKLEEDRKRYEALLKQSSDAIALVDAVSTKIIDVNSRLCEISGYSEQELFNMNIYQLLADPTHNITECQSELASNRCLPAATRWIKCKDGSTIEVERVGSLIDNNAKMLELLTFYDVSEERRLQQIINEEAVLASQVQRRMLPRNFQNDVLEIAGIYKPLHMVSGDFFDYRFSADHKTLTGFLVDVAGHGLATALQTAAINVLLQDVIIHEKMPTTNELQVLNNKTRAYFNESDFAALIIFHFDFEKNILSCACCGINQILTFCREKRGWVKAKGSFIGAFDDPVFDVVSIPLQSGDCFYFLTDGLSDKLNETVCNDLCNFHFVLGYLTDLAGSSVVQDDCSAVCINIKKVTRHCRYDFAGMDDVEKLQKIIRHQLENIAGNHALHLEIALNEAINNVLLHGSGEGCFTIKRIRRRIILRIKDAWQGFDVRSALHPFESESTGKIAERVLSSETGRGYLIMKLFTDMVYYNRNGSEVMLVYRSDI